MINLASAGLTDVGRTRKENQDAFSLDDGRSLYVVTDGMGGHRAGEIASRLVVEAFRRFFAGKIEGSPLPHDPSLSTDANHLLGAIHAANRTIHRASLKSEDFQGMGATVSAVLFSDGTVAAANVGDSPIYLIHRKTIQEISEPHTLAAEYAPQDAAELPPDYHHILTRAVGIEETVTAHVCELSIFPGDILVLASDGLSNMVPPEEILAAALAHPPEAACRYLTALANDRGGEDNITIVIAAVSPGAFRKGGGLFIHFMKRLFPGFENRRHHKRRNK